MWNCHQFTEFQFRWLNSVRCAINEASTSDKQHTFSPKLYGFTSTKLWFRSHQLQVSLSLASGFAFIKFRSCCHQLLVLPVINRAITSLAGGGAGTVGSDYWPSILAGSPQPWQAVALQIFFLLPSALTAAFFITLQVPPLPLVPSRITHRPRPRCRSDER